MMFIRRVWEFVLFLLSFVLVGILFMLFSTARYTPAGIVGTSNALWFLISLAFFVTLPLLTRILGKHHCLGAYCALTFCLLYLVFAGIAVYLGAQPKFWIYPFYVLIAPFTPIIALLKTISAYLTLIVPVISLTVSLFTYIVAHNKANQKAVDAYYDEIRVHAYDDDYDEYDNGYDRYDYGSAEYEED